jgi:transitional endoplasmic reticulum ATPase
MGITTAEKEWLKRFGNHKPVKEDKLQTEEKPKNKEIQSSSGRVGKGFKDVAGMTQLKELVIEGFINVLKNKECAEAYGINPPSLLLYGPAGCGKTFFAEKVAEELGINFMKVVPDDLACTWIHGTQQKIGELFRKAEQFLPLSVSYSFDGERADILHLSSICYLVLYTYPQKQSLKNRLTILLIWNPQDNQKIQRTLF